MMAVQLIAGLSLIVGIHEAGHLLAAKAFGMRVEKFYVGFPPKIWGRAYRGTEYCIGTVPLGGFVKISGMLDESMDVGSLKAPPQPWEFRAKPRWQRLVVMVAGIVLNLVLGIVIFSTREYIEGWKYYPAQEINRFGVHPTEMGERHGFCEGDKILSINGEAFNPIRSILPPELLYAKNPSFRVLREGKELDVEISGYVLDILVNEGADDPEFLRVRIPFLVGEVSPGTQAFSAGLRAGDKILSIGGDFTPFTYNFFESLRRYQGQQVTLEIDREGTGRRIEYQVGKNGIPDFEVDRKLLTKVLRYSVFEAVTIGTARAFGVVRLNLMAFSRIFSGGIPLRESLSGPIGIARIFRGHLDWGHFFTTTGLISIILAFMNFLPIPGLDGGHILFLLVEMISGKTLPARFMEVTQIVGIAILGAIMVFAITNDIIKLF